MKDEERPSYLKYTIVLNRVLPRRKSMHIRYRVNGEKISTELIMQLLRDAGYIVTTIEEPTFLLANKWKNIPIKSMSNGLTVYPKDPKDYDKLVAELVKDGYFYHGCHLLTKRNPNTEKK